MALPLQDDLPIGVLRLDSTLEVCAVSPEFLADFGCTAEDVIGVEITELVASRDRRATTRLDRNLGSPSTTRVDTIAILDVGGRQRLTRLLVRRRTDAEGWSVLVECIDEGDNHLRELFTQHRRWSRALKESVQGFVFVDESLHITDHNARFVELLDFRSNHGVLLAEEALAGCRLPELLARNPIHAELRATLERMWGRTATYGHVELEGRWLELEVRPLYVPPQGLAGHGVSVRDITDHRRAEQERAERQQEQLRHHSELIAAQREAIRSLSAPRIPLTTGLTIVPLIGELDVERMAEIRDDLLVAVSSTVTRTLILDITGVPALDDASVGALIETVRALRLVGVRALLTGARPAVAQALASGGHDAGPLEFHRNVAAALAATVPH